MNNRQGFTIVEVVVAMMVLSIGVLALVSSSALITRMVGNGQHATRATQLAEQRLERLRQTAHSTAIPCQNLNGGTTIGATANGMTESWQVVVNGTQRILTANATYNVPRGTRTVTLRTILSCSPTT